MEKQNFIEKIINKLYSTVIILFLFIVALFFDVVYIQKVVLSKFTITVLRALNANIIFDFDDAIFIYKDMIHLLTNSACVIVSNSFLKNFASKYNRRVYKLISPVEIDGRPFQKKDNLITLGWIGSPETSKYLYQLIPVFKSLKEKFENLNIEFMGAEKNRYFELLNIKITEWSLEREKGYLQKVDIGIMPLIDDELSRGKAGYKLLQYMAAGIPCVASPVGINKEIVESGKNGFLANMPDEWLDKLSLLIRDTSLRQRFGQEGRRLSEEFYSYNVNVPRLIEVFQNIL